MLHTSCTTHLTAEAPREQPCQHLLEKPKDSFTQHRGSPTPRRFFSSIIAASQALPRVQKTGAKRSAKARVFGCRTEIQDGRGWVVFSSVVGSRAKCTAIASMHQNTHCYTNMKTDSDLATKRWRLPHRRPGQLPVELALVRRRPLPMPATKKQRSKKGGPHKTSQAQQEWT